jgi:hypothetical protein
MLWLPKKQKLIFITGAILTLGFSILIGVLGVGVLYLLGIPFLGLIAGIVLIWFSNVSVLTKVILSIAPAPMIIAVFAFVIFVNTAEAESFLIPGHYRGEIVVFYNEPCGQPAEYLDGRRVYRLSADGVLITQHSENRGFFNRRFFLVDGDNIQREITHFGRQNFETEKEEWGKYTPRATDEELTKRTVGVFWAYGAETYNASRNSIAYIVSDYHSFDHTHDKERFLERKRFTAKALELLDRCRESRRSDKSDLEVSNLN